MSKFKSWNFNIRVIYTWTSFNLAIITPRTSTWPSTTSLSLRCSTWWNLKIQHTSIYFFLSLWESNPLLLFLKAGANPSLQPLPRQNSGVSPFNFLRALFLERPPCSFPACQELKRLSEEGLESNNKRLRTYRITLSRKMSQKANLEDCLTRLWIGSDPAVGAEQAKGCPFWEECKETGHTKQSCAKKLKCHQPKLRMLKLILFFE